MPVVTHREQPLFSDNYEINGDTTVYSNDFKFPDLPNEIGYYSLFLFIEDNGSEILPDVEVNVKLQFIFDSENEIYGELHDVLDDTGSNSLTVGTKWEARLDKQSWWKFAEGFRIAITTSGGGGPKLKITYAGVHAR